MVLVLIQKLFIAYLRYLLAQSELSHEITVAAMSDDDIQSYFKCSSEVIAIIGQAISPD